MNNKRSQKLNLLIFIRLIKSCIYNSRVCLVLPLFIYFSSNCSTITSSNDLPDSTFITDPNITKNTIVTCRPVRFGNFAITTIANGLIQTSSQSRLSFRISGTISEINVSNGSKINKGQLLAKLDDQDQRIALRIAQDQVAESRVQLRGLIAEYGGNEIDTASLKPNARLYVLTKSGYYKAQTALAQAQQQLAYTELRVPYSGVVANLTSKPFNFITSYEPFCTLYGQVKLLVEFSVLESELASLHVGQYVRVTPIAFPDKIYKGQITEVNPFVNQQGIVSVKASIYQPYNNLLEGMNVRVVIERLLKDQLIIPKSAIVERSGRKVIFSIKSKGDKAKHSGITKSNWHYVTILNENDSEVVIAINNDLKAGDWVIISGNLNLAQDSPVNVQ